MKIFKIIALILGALIVINVLVHLGSNQNNSLPTSPPQTNTNTDNTSTSPDITIVQKSAKGNPDVPGIVTIYCVCRNNSDELKGYVEIDASFFDKNDKILGTGMGNTTNFPAHSERTIDVMAMNIDNSCTHYTVDLKDGF